MDAIRSVQIELAPVALAANFAAPFAAIQCISETLIRWWFPARSEANVRLADREGYTVVPTEQTIVRAKVELLELAKQLGSAYTQEIAQVAASANANRAKERVEVVGELLDVSNIKRTFRMKVDDNIIQGKFGDVISPGRPVELPKSYRATLKVLQKIVFDDGNEEIFYFLERLESPEGTVDRKQP